VVWPIGIIVSTMLLSARKSTTDTPTRTQHRVPPRLAWALVLVLVFHGSLLLSGSFTGTYDAYVHMFLGDHYARGWFSTWEQRWYTGFTTVSYPPGTHMALGAISKVTGSLNSAFIIVQTSILMLLTVGMYRFSRIWVNERAAANAALLLVVSSAIAETVHVFGQLPTTFALAFLLNAIPYMRAWLFGGQFRDLATGVITLAACTAGHHADKNLGLVFFAIPWGFMIVVLPYAIVRALASRMWPLAASIGLLFVLGTGGTTPIPKMLLGHAFDILTLDRFTFWASMMILPLAGLFVESVEDGAIARWLRETGGKVLLRGVHIFAVVAMLGFTLFAANLSAFRPFQPDPIDTDPIVAFIEKDQHERWRFLTLGFGDQVAALSAATTATQVDGNYHSARRLPELTSTSVERLEGAKYRGTSGLGSSAHSRTVSTCGRRPTSNRSRRSFRSMRSRTGNDSCGALFRQPRC